MADDWWPQNHEGCAAHLHSQMGSLGTEVVVSTAHPLVIGSHPPAAFECPHGTVYWLEPTGEQRARWGEDGAP